MDKVFWNDAAKWGLLIGIIMGSSRLLEYSFSMSGDVSRFTLYTFEWIVVAITYSVLLLRAVENRARIVYKKIGFSIGYCVNYTMVISAFASIIVTALSHIYIESIVGGYMVYVEKFISSVNSVFEQMEIDSSIAELYTTAFNEMKNSDNVPSLLDMFISNLSTYILSGVVVGFLVSLIAKRRINKSIKDGE